MTRALPDHWFYAPNDAHAPDLREFPAEEARHASKALRLRVGDDIQWIDGEGGRYEGRIQDISRLRMVAYVTAGTREVPPAPVGLYVGRLHDATRLEWLVEKATELGATEITLLDTERVQRTRYRMERLQAKALAAAKQSARAYLPTIREEDFGAMVSEADGTLRVIAHCYRDLTREPLSGLIADAQPISVFIGPEGDFTRDEVALALASGIRAVSLGTARLRTETAAVAALSVLALR